MGSCRGSALFSRPIQLLLLLVNLSLYPAGRLLEQIFDSDFVIKGAAAHAFGFCF